MKHIVLLGADGQIGFELQKKLAPLGKLTALCVPEIDFCNPEATIATLQQLRPQLIVNAAAYTNVDGAETHADLAMQINYQTPLALAQYAASINAIFVHYSTDYVFDGNRNLPYSENDPTNPLSVYGLSKLRADEAILKCCPRALIFRTSWIYGPRGHNFFLRILQLAQEREILKIVNDQIGSPTTSRHVAETTAAILATILSAEADQQTAAFGLFHLTCSGDVSWHGFAQHFLERTAKKSRRLQQLLAVPSTEYPQVAHRPLHSVLNCTKLETTFGLKMAHWQDALETCIQEYQEERSKSEKTGTPLPLPKAGL